MLSTSMTELQCFLQKPYTLCRKNAGMKTGHEAAALDLMSSAITTECCFWEAKADVDMLPGAISNIRLLLSR